MNDVRDPATGERTHAVIAGRYKLFVNGQHFDDFATAFAARAAGARFSPALAVEVVDGVLDLRSVREGGRWKVFAAAAKKS